jgi:fatty acid desaturase
LEGDAKPRKKAPRGHARPIDKELLRVDPGVMIKKLVVFAGLLAIGGAAALSSYVAGWILGSLLLGAMFAHGVELTHQFLHGTGFRGRAANRVFGVACALPMLVSHSHYRALHLAHHRNLGTPANKEFFNYGNVKGRPFLIVFARAFSLARYLGLAKNIFGAVTGKAPYGATGDQERRAINVEYLLMLAVITGVVAFTAITRSTVAIRLWVIPLLVVAEPIHFWVELPEHFGCDLSTRNVLHNTRTVRGSWLSFWFTNGNNFHVERVHTTLRNDIQFFNQSYWAFLGTVLAPERAVEPAASDAPYLETMDAGEIIDAGGAIEAGEARAPAALEIPVGLVSRGSKPVISQVPQETA